MRVLLTYMGMNVVLLSRVRTFTKDIDSQKRSLVRSYTTDDGSRQRTLDLFWNNLYNKIQDSEGSYKYTNVSLYHNEVLTLLRQYEGGKDFDMLLKLQLLIEDMTMKFDEKSVFKSSSNLIKLLIGKDMITAKEFLKQKKCDLSENDLKLIHEFGQYTLEALIINVLGSMFNCVNELSVVKASTLMEQIDSAVRVQAVTIARNKAAGSSKTDVKLDSKQHQKVTRSDYVFGVRLLEFLNERQLLSFYNETSYTDVLPVSKKNSKGYYLPNYCYAMCNFDLSLLPIKLNLPMVCTPVPWHSKVEEPSTFADMQGGYLSELTGEFYNRFRLLTSRDYSHFYIKLNYQKDLCSILNKLQSQVFEINSKVLTFILGNRDTLEDKGLLMNRSLANVNLQEASDLLRFCYVSNEGVKEVCSCKVLLRELVKRAQRARYEDFVLNLAVAYSGFQFYLPAFMDFRGRIYRAGVLHFHERDLSKSLIVFANDAKELELEQELNKETQYYLRMQLASAAAFKYKKFSSINEGRDWYLNNFERICESDESLINSALQASDPFQFIAKVISCDRVSDQERIRGLNRVPVTQDASASAYQIMSYMLLNKEMGIRTNLLPSPEGQIQDFYMFLKDELQVFLHSRLDTNKYAILESRLTRKLVKVLFMPLIYGKTVITMASDIREVYGSLLSFKDAFYIAQLCHEFWKKKYPDIANFMKLINLIGGFCSVLDKPVLYSIPYFTTVQDYMRSKKADIWVYDRVCKKRRRITLRVATSDRDKRKTQVSTCVNFIHQKDAYIAMKVVEEFTSNMNTPVYTVHENFITTAVYADVVPNIYTKVFMDMGHPLGIINEFLNLNLDIYQEKKEFSNHIYNYPISDPIPGELLREILKSLDPKDIKDKSKWDQKIKEICSCYEEYVNTVCGEALLPEGHAAKWHEFNELLQSWESFEWNYSVHY